MFITGLVIGLVVGVVIGGAIMHYCINVTVDFLVGKNKKLL